MKKAPETTVILSSRLQSQTGRDSFTQSAIELFLKNIGIATLTAWAVRPVKKPGADKVGTKPPVMILGTR